MSRDTCRGPSVASRALDDFCKENNDEAEALRNGRCGVHRTVIWRLRTGRRSPDLSTAALIEKATGGRVRTTDWAVRITGRLRSHEVRARAA